VTDPTDLAALLADLGLPEAPEPLPGFAADSHTHLDAVEERSGLRPDDALALAAAVGIDRIVQVGCDEPSSLWAAEFALAHPSVVAAVALHPNEVARHPERTKPGVETVERLAGAGAHVRAIGETGLDYFRTTEPEGQVLQREAFAAHIEIAAAHDLTLVIHDRDAHDDILDVLAGSTAPSRVVMHCFSGDADFAHRCLDRGYWLSFPGVTTYKANHHLRRALAVTPPDRLLVETDAPYLTPVPARGRPNSTYLLPHTIRFVAEQREWDLAETCALLTRNTMAAFGGAWPALGEIVPEAVGSGPKSSPTDSGPASAPEAGATRG
jgi:TatD DNase family protein